MASCAFRLARLLMPSLAACQVCHSSMCCPGASQSRCGLCSRSVVALCLTSLLEVSVPLWHAYLLCSMHALSVVLHALLLLHFFTIRLVAGLPYQHETRSVLDNHAQQHGSRPGSIWCARDSPHNAVINTSRSVAAQTCTTSS